MTRTRTRRGRPSKFDRPSRAVALTLPGDTIAGLRKVDADLGWAIVKLVEKRRKHQRSAVASRPDPELVAIPDGRFLIVVNRAVLKRLPGVHVIPLDRNRAFLALKLGGGVSDLELAILDRLEDGVSDGWEHDALARLRAQLRQWRRDPTLTFEQRTIIVARRTTRRRAR